jgi:hypothetical protein
MSIAEMPGNPREPAGFGAANLDERLGRRFDPNGTPILEDEQVTVTEPSRPIEIEEKVETLAGS